MLRPAPHEARTPPAGTASSADVADAQLRPPCARLLGSGTFHARLSVLTSPAPLGRAPSPSRRADRYSDRPCAAALEPRQLKATEGAEEPHQLPPASRLVFADASSTRSGSRWARTAPLRLRGPRRHRHAQAENGDGRPDREYLRPPDMRGHDHAASHRVPPGRYGDVLPDAPSRPPADINTAGAGQHRPHSRGRADGMLTPVGSTHECD